MEHRIANPVHTGRGRDRVLITGAGGQLGAALIEVFPDATAYTHAELSVVTRPLDLGFQPNLVLHAAAWTDVDEAERREDLARLVNVDGTRNVGTLGAPIVYFSTDYVFDGSKREPYVESDVPNPVSAYGRTKFAGEREVADGWIVRTSWLFGWTGSNFVRTMLAIADRRDEVQVVNDQVGSPTYVGDLACAVPQVLDLHKGLWHVAAAGECTWAEFARAIFEDSGRQCHVTEITSEQLARPAARPAYSVLRSEKEGAPTLPPWREGLRKCLDRLGALR